MPKAKTIAKWSLIGLAGLLLSGALALGLGYSWLRGDSGRAWLKQQIEAAVSTPGEMELTIGRLDGDLPANLAARDIILRDAEGAWLTIGALELDWRPWALLGRTLEIDGLTLSSVDLARLPATPPEAAAEEAEDSGDPFAFPLQIRLKRLAADEIALGEPVIGHAARLTLTGEAARGDDGTLNAKLDLRRIDGFDGHLSADLLYDPASDLLTAKAEAASAPGGLVAALLDMPDLPGTRLQLSGSGPLAAWVGDFTFHLGDLLTAEAAIGLERRGAQDIAFRLEGHNTVLQPGADPAWQLVEGRTNIALQGAWQDDRRLRLDSFSARNAAASLAVSGDVEPESGRLDLSISAEAAGSTALAELAGLDRLDDLSAEIALSGTINSPRADLRLESGPLASPDVTAAALSVEGRIAAENDLLGRGARLALDLSGRINEPRLPGQDAVNQVVGDTLPLSLAGTLGLDNLVLDIAALETAIGAAALTASGPFDLGEGEARLETALNVGDLAALQPLTEIALGGRATLTGPVTLANYGAALDADLAGRWDEPASDIGLLQVLAGKGLDLTARLSLAGGDLRLETVTASSSTTRLEAALTVAGGELRDGRYNLALTDAKILAGELGVDLAGAARVEGRISGPFDALALDGTAKIARLSLAEQSFTDLDAGYDLRIRGADIDGPVRLALTTPFGPGEARSDLRVRPDAVTLGALQASLPQTKVAGEVTVPLDGGEPRADLNGDFADLGPWLALAELDGGGQGKVTVKWNQPGAAAPLLAEADLTAFSLRPEPGAEPLSIARLTLNLTAQDPALSEAASLKASAEDLRWQRLELARLDLDGRGTAEDLDLTLTSKGAWIEPIELQATARIARQGETTRITLRDFAGEAFGQPLSLREAASLTLAPTETRLEGLDLASGDTRLTADARLDGGAVTARASLESLPLSTVEAFWDSGLDGVVSAELDLQGTQQNPRGTASLTASGLRPRDGKDLPELTLTAKGDWQSGRVKLDGELGGAEVTSAAFAAEAPLRLSADGNSLEVPEQGALSGKLDWRGGIDTLLLFVPLPQHRLNGTAQVDLALSGTVAAPSLDGEIALTEGRYESLEHGTLLRDLTLRAELSDDKVKLTRLDATDGVGGRISGNGEVTVDPAQDFPFQVAIQFEDFRAVHRDDVTAVTDGTLKLLGDSLSPKVEGRFTTETVEVSLLAQLPPNVVSLDVIEVKDGVVQEAPPEAEAAPPVDAELDIIVDMPRRVFVRGRGLDSEWAGRISVQGSAAAPQVTGELNVVRGQMSVVGKTFALEEGKVTLPQGANAEPTINVAAVHEGPQLEVTATLSGPVTRPELELTSSPEVPRDEIISRVLFGKSAANLSAAEAAQLALAVRELTGQGGGTDILGFARRSLGVDVLRVDTTDDGKAAVEAGKYLTDEVYLGVKQGATPESSAVGVEVELTPNITVESETTGTGVNKSGVRFQLDY